MCVCVCMCFTGLHDMFYFLQKVNPSNKSTSNCFRLILHNQGHNTEVVAEAVSS